MAAGANLTLSRSIAQTALIENGFVRISEDYEPGPRCCRSLPSRPCGRFSGLGQQCRADGGCVKTSSVEQADSRDVAGRAAPERRRASQQLRHQFRKCLPST
jgi:hypothetical protein